MTSYSRPKLLEFYTLFKTKLLENHTLHSGTYPCSLSLYLSSYYESTPPPPPPPPHTHTHTHTHTPSMGCTGPSKHCKKLSVLKVVSGKISDILHARWWDKHFFCEPETFWLFKMQDQDSKKALTKNWDCKTHEILLKSKEFKDHSLPDPLYCLYYDSFC